ncbi:MAG: hypothetical protein ACT4P7_14075 [Gemmatimonadaceae bacterium]
MARTKRPTPITSDNPAIAGPRAPADRLYRAAAECVRQRQRYSALVEAGALDEEQFAALEIASICDVALHQARASYAGSPTNGAYKDEEWHRKALLLWQASREYERRHSASDLRTRQLGTHTRDGLKKLAMEYDLEASALLALQHALSAYRKAVPEAHIETCASRMP